MQLSSFVLMFLLQCFFYPVRNSSGWLSACSSCTSQDTRGHPTGFVLPQHPSGTERGQTAAKGNLPRDKADICCLHKEVLELSANSRQLCTARGGTPGKPRVGIQSGASPGRCGPVAPCPCHCSYGCPVTCDTHPAAVSHPCGTLSSTTLSDHNEDIFWQH